jgi:hypothetical protein
MADILSELQTIIRLNGDTYSSAEVVAVMKRAAVEIERIQWALEEIIQAADTDGPPAADMWHCISKDLIERARAVLADPAGGRP